MIWININLLPENLRKKEAKPLSEDLSKKVVFTAAAFLAVLLTINMLLGIYIVVKGGMLSRARKEWESVRPSSEKIDRLSNGIARYENDLANIESVLDINFQWAKALDEIALALPEKIWLEDIDVEKGYLYIQGGVVSPEAREMTALKEFIDNLSRSTLLGFYLEDLSIDSVDRDSIGGTPILDFVLKAQLGEDIGQGD